MLDELGLSAALKSYAAGFAERTKINVELEVTSDLGQLSKDHELGFSRSDQPTIDDSDRWLRKRWNA